MAGFLGLEDLTHSRGELALVVQTDKKNFSIEAVASLPDTSISSVQDAYLSASLSSVLPAFPRHKGQSEQHYKRQNPSVLEPSVSSLSEKSTQLLPYPILHQENVKIVMKKHKSVMKKVRPIIGDLPSVTAHPQTMPGPTGWNLHPHWLDSSHATLISGSGNHPGTFRHDLTRFCFPSIIFLFLKEAHMDSCMRFWLFGTV